jgi:hypothetical protein
LIVADGVGELMDEEAKRGALPSHNPITLLRPANPPCSRCPPSVAGPRFR